LAAEAARAPLMTCLACGVNVITARPDRRYCSGRCRARASRERKARELQELIARLQAEARLKRRSPSPSLATRRRQHRRRGDRLTKVFPRPATRTTARGLIRSGNVTPWQVHVSLRRRICERVSSRTRSQGGTENLYYLPVEMRDRPKVISRARFRATWGPDNRGFPIVEGLPASNC